ncbi:MAG: uracil-DNA glycosylase family protein [Actinomycetia bacterium]|nr:uracil-DNA glycosylase family protein [Actinomycetes bacterium]
MPKSPVIRVDPSRTRRRIDRLRRYVDSELLCRNKFKCSDAGTCRSSVREGHVFLPGTMSHVGRRFDLTLGAKQLRVVVIGQEAKSSQVTLDKRYEDVLSTGLNQRYKRDRDHDKRTAHMKGTTSALRVIFGHEPGYDWDSEWIHPQTGRKFHMFDGFALINTLLCYAGPHKGVQARPTNSMVNNCARHLRNTLAILEPTLIILQGRKAQQASTNALRRGQIYSDHVREAFLDDHRMVVCAFSHPSARLDQRWGTTPHDQYLTDIVKPSLRKALRHLPKH